MNENQKNETTNRNTQKDNNIISLYSIYDREQDTFSVPFVSKNNIEAKRSVFATAINRDSNLFHFPEQFELVKISAYNLNTGQMIPSDNEQSIESVALVSTILQYYTEVREDYKK